MDEWNNPRNSCKWSSDIAIGVAGVSQEDQDSNDTSLGRIVEQSNQEDFRHADNTRKEHKVINLVQFWCFLTLHASSSSLYCSLAEASGACAVESGGKMGGLQDSADKLLKVSGDLSLH